MSKRKILNEGEPCRKCETSVIRKEGTPKPNTAYWFEYFFLCPNCGEVYLVESAKRYDVEEFFPKLF